MCPSIQDCRLSVTTILPLRWEFYSSSQRASKESKSQFGAGSGGRSNKSDSGMQLSAGRSCSVKGSSIALPTTPSGFASPSEAVPCSRPGHSSALWEIGASLPEGGGNLSVRSYLAVPVLHGGMAYGPCHARDRPDERILMPRLPFLPLRSVQEIPHWPRILGKWRSP